MSLIIPMVIFMQQRMAEAGSPRGCEGDAGIHEDGAALLWGKGTGTSGHI